MQSISLSQIKTNVVQEKNKILDYELNFFTTNPLPLWSLIEISFISNGSIALFENSNNLKK